MAGAGNLVLFGMVNLLWYAVPLIVAVALVYSATRDERLGPILRHALRLMTTIIGFMAAVFAVLLFVSWLH